jgi:serine/threonine protein kinase
MGAGCSSSSSASDPTLGGRSPSRSSHRTPSDGVGGGEGDLGAKQGAGEATVSETTEEASKELHRFELLSEIGKGAFGVVYKAIVKGSDRVVALKAIRCSHVRESDKALEEVRSMIALRHENIVDCSSFFLNNFDVWIVLEFCEGGDLATVITTLHRSNRKLQERTAVRWTYQMLKAVRHLHAHNVIHRDIKSSNSTGFIPPLLTCAVFLTKDLQVIKLGDFGLARRLKDFKTANVAGTPFFMAPELFNERPCTPAVDVWAIGCVMVTMCLPKGFLKKMGMMSVIALLPEDKMELIFAAIVQFGFSSAYADFVRRVLEKDEALRPSAASLLDDDFFRDVSDRERSGLSIAGPSARSQREGSSGSSLTPSDIAAAVQSERLSGRDFDSGSNEGSEVSMGAILSLPNIVVMVVDADGVVRSWNKGAENLLEWRAKDLVGIRFLSSLVPVDFTERLAEMMGHATGGDAALVDGLAYVAVQNPHLTRVWPLLTKSGGVVMLQIFAVPVWDVRNAQDGSQVVGAMKKYYILAEPHKVVSLESSSTKQSGGGGEEESGKETLAVGPSQESEDAFESKMMGIVRERIEPSRHVVKRELSEEKLKATALSPRAGVVSPREGLVE